MKKMATTVAAAPSLSEVKIQDSKSKKKRERRKRKMLEKNQSGNNEDNLIEGESSRDNMNWEDTAA